MMHIPQVLRFKSMVFAICLWSVTWSAYAHPCELEARYFFGETAQVDAKTMQIKEWEGILNNRGEVVSIKRNPTAREVVSEASLRNLPNNTLLIWMIVSRPDGIKLIFGEEVPLGGVTPEGEPKTLGHPTLGVGEKALYAGEAVKQTIAGRFSGPDEVVIKINNRSGRISRNKTVSPELALQEASKMLHDLTGAKIDYKIWTPKVRGLAVPVTTKKDGLILP